MTAILGVSLYICGGGTISLLQQFLYDWNEYGFGGSIYGCWTFDKYYKYWCIKNSVEDEMFLFFIWPMLLSMQ